MAFDDIAKFGANRVQVSCTLNISKHAKGWVSSPHPPAKEHTITRKGYEVTKVTVAGEEYSEVTTSGALTGGTYWIDTSQNNVDLIYVEAATIADDEQIQNYKLNPDNSELEVGNLGEPIPGDATAYDEFQGYLAISGGFDPSEVTQEQRNWMVYMALQQFFYYVVENSISVYGYYEPYFYRGDLSGKKAFYDAWANEFEPGSYFDYTSFVTMEDDYSAIRDVGYGSQGWYVIIKYVSATNSTPALTMSTKKENYLDGAGDRNFNTFLQTGGTTHDLDEDVVRIDFALGLAKHSDITSNIYEAPRIISTPKVEKRIETFFGKPIQRGGGTLVLNNADGYFDDLQEYTWSGNTVDITMKIAKPGDEFSAGETQTIGRYLMTDVTFTKERVNVKVEELTKHFEAGFPLRFFDEIADTNVYEENQGQHIPYVYGQVYAVKAFPVKKAGKIFQVADHPIHSIANPKVRINGEWEPATINTTDYESARFSITNWEDGQDVICDVNGLVDGDGSLMNNPADIASHILTQMNFATVNQASITNSKTYYDVATGFPFNRVDKEVGLYISEPGKVSDIFQQINQSCQSYLRFNNLQEIEFKAWYPHKRTDISFAINDHELISYDLITSEKDIITELHSLYQFHEETDESKLVKVESQGKFKYNFGGERVREFKTRAATYRAALNIGQKVMTILGDELKLYRVRIKFRALPWLPGDQVRLNITRWGHNEIVEIISVSHDLMAGVTNLVLSNRRNWVRSSGWYASPSATAYSLFETNQEKQDRFEEDGYYSDDNGFLDDQDILSYLTTRYL